MCALTATLEKSSKSHENIEINQIEFTCFRCCGQSEAYGSFSRIAHFIVSAHNQLHIFGKLCVHIQRIGPQCAMCMHGIDIDSSLFRPFSLATAPSWSIGRLWLKFKMQ